MVHEVKIPLTAPLRSVESTDPFQPLPPLPPGLFSGSSEEEEFLKKRLREEREAEERRLREEHAEQERCQREERAERERRQREEEGRRQREEERARLEHTLAVLAKTARELKAEQGQRLAEMQLLAVELAVAIAAQLTHERIESDDFAVETLVRKMVGRLDPEQAVTVHLHPDDIALLQKRVGDQPLFANEAEIRLAADPSLRRGDCRAETGDLVVISRLQEQLTDIHQRLLGRIGEAVSDRREETEEEQSPL